MKNNAKKLSDAVIVSIDMSRGIDNDVMIVGRQTKGKMEVINAFQGAEARMLWGKLTTKKEK